MDGREFLVIDLAIIGEEFQPELGLIGFLKDSVDFGAKLGL
ncbi:MAG: hypothetical protein RLZZ214_3977 [Verrucomicrobiota bacterium]